MFKICEYCNKEFETEKSNKRFCCRSCKEKNKQKRIRKGIRFDNLKYTNVCIVCGKLFVTKYQDKCYCSQECKSKKFNEYLQKYKELNVEYLNSPVFKIRNVMYQMLYRCNKNISCKDFWYLFEYTPDELVEHLEKQFKPDMNWDNHGILWEVDHIRPFASYKFVDKNGNYILENIKDVIKIENIRPLYKKENHTKSAIYNGCLYSKGEVVNSKK